MTITKTESDGSLAVALGGESDLRDAAGFRAALLECLECSRPTLVTVQALENVDFSLLQLIESARRTFAAAGVSFSVDAGDAFRRVWSETGLEPLEDASYDNHDR